MPRMIHTLEIPGNVELIVERRPKRLTVKVYGISAEGTAELQEVTICARGELRVVLDGPIVEVPGHHSIMSRGQEEDVNGR